MAFFCNFFLILEFFYSKKKQIYEDSSVGTIWVWNCKNDNLTASSIEKYTRGIQRGRKK